MPDSDAPFPVDGLLPIDDAGTAAMQDVQNSGRTLRFAEVDEAELVAVGLTDAQRQGRPPLTDSQVSAAADRLISRGLAEPVRWAAGAVRPAGGLLLYAQLALHARARSGLTQSWVLPAQPGTELARRQISVLIDVARAGLACVATSAVPTVDPPASVPVTLDLLRLDELVRQIVAEAFSGGARETVVAFADGSGALTPSRLRVDTAGRGELETSRHGLLRARTARTPLDASGFAEHLQERLMAAG